MEQEHKKKYIEKIIKNYGITPKQRIEMPNGVIYLEKFLDEFADLILLKQFGLLGNEFIEKALEFRK